MEKQRVVDCIIFYNELDMLEYRLSVLYPYVDAFVLVESTRTFIGNLKPLFYHENRERYAKYADKIVHVVVDDFWEKPTVGFEYNSNKNQWYNEMYQRNAVSYGIEELVKRGVMGNLKDIIMISDLDEIIDPEAIPMIKEYLDKEKHPETGGVVGLNMDFYYYNLKCMFDGMYTDKTRVVNYERYLAVPWLEISHSKKVKDISSQIRGPSCFMLPKVAGWHMSYFGSEYFIENKIKQFAHQEYNSDKYTNPEKIKEIIKKGEDLFGRELETKRLKTIEYSENKYLPPFPPCPEGTDPWSLFPFCLQKKDTEKQRVVDCFIFYNELDMLEYRLSLLYPHIDAFVLVESTRTHKGTPKPLYYQENRERFAAYTDKIVHIVMDDLLAEPKIDYDLLKGEQWVNEKHQRDGITFGIDALVEGKMGWKLGEKDILLISDVDEIVDITKLDVFSQILEHPDVQGLVSIAMDMYYYNLKHKFHEIWTHPKAVHYSYYLKLPFVEPLYPGMKKVRNISEGVRLSKSLCLVGSYGWHLSYFGNAEMISNKLKEFGHQEYNSTIFTNVESIRERMEKGLDILGRNQSLFSFEKIELSENPYLPPFPPGVSGTDTLSQFPFCL